MIPIGAVVNEINSVNDHSPCFRSLLLIRLTRLPLGVRTRPLGNRHPGLQAEASFFSGHTSPVRQLLGGIISSLSTSTHHSLHFTTAFSFNCLLLLSNTSADPRSSSGECSPSATSPMALVERPLLTSASPHWHRRHEASFYSTFCPYEENSLSPSTCLLKTTADCSRPKGPQAHQYAFSRSHFDLGRPARRAPSTGHRAPGTDLFRSSVPDPMIGLQLNETDWSFSSGTADPFA